MIKPGWPFKKTGFSAQFLYKIEVIIEKLELPNIDDMTTFTIEFESRDRILFENNFILRRPDQPILLASLKLHLRWLKQLLRSQEKSKEL